MTPTQHAAALHEQGFKVFPLIQNGKTPAVKDWQRWAENATLDMIAPFSKNNWGVYCGASDLVVIDLDVKRDDANGIASFKALTNGNLDECTDTMIVRTPTGGLHLYYRGVGRTSASALGAGVDTRGIGGYVVAPGSVIDDEPYRPLNDKPIAPLPFFLGELLEAEKPKVLADDEPVLEGERNDTLASLAGTMRSRGMGYDAILAALHAVNENQLAEPLPEKEIETIAGSVARYAPDIAQAASDFLELPNIMATKASEISAAAIKPRNWLMDRRYIGGHISVIISPGGVGKSILTMLDAMAIATGKPLTGFNVKAPAGVWVYNTEDPSDELRRRMVALAQHHGVDLSTLDNVHLTSGREIPLILAKAGRDGLAINKNATDSIIAYIKANHIKVMLADPFVRTHEVSENDNMQIDKVVWCFQRIADKTGCAIGVVHHARKMGTAGKADMDSARGASALVNAARVAHVLQTMDSAAAKKYGVPDDGRYWYMRLDDAKANLQPPASAANWFKKVSVQIGNGDAVGVVERVTLTDMTIQQMDIAKVAEARDIARALADILTIGKSIKVTEAWDVIANACPHLVDLSDKRGQRKLIAAARSDACWFSTKQFTYEALGDGPKPRHWIVCTRHEPQDDDFLA